MNTIIIIIIQIIYIRKKIQSKYHKNKNIIINKRDTEYDDEYDKDDIIFDNNHH